MENIFTSASRAFETLSCVRRKPHSGMLLTAMQTALAEKGDEWADMGSACEGQKAGERAAHAWPVPILHH